MEIWLDTCDYEAIASASRYGFIHGITTNPSILSQAKEPYDFVIAKLLEIQKRPLMVQIIADEADEIVSRAMALHAFSNRIIVKIPVFQEGLIAIKRLSDKDIPVLATAVFQPRQALVAAQAGAQYVAPYISRMFDAGIDAYAALESMVKMYKEFGIYTKILAAGLRTTDQIIACAEMGVDAVTLKSSLFQQLIEDDPMTAESIRAFQEDWETRECQPACALEL